MRAGEIVCASPRNLAGTILKNISRHSASKRTQVVVPGEGGNGSRRSGGRAKKKTKETETVSPADVRGNDIQRESLLIRSCTK